MDIRILKKESNNQRTEYIMIVVYASLLIIILFLNKEKKDVKSKRNKADKIGKPGYFYPIASKLLNMLRLKSTKNLKRLSSSFLVFTIFLILGIVLSINQMSTDTNKKEEIIRPAHNEKEFTIDVVVEDEKTTSIIPVLIKKKEYSKEESIDIIRNSYESLEKTILNGNNNFDEVYTNLNFTTELEEYNLKLDYKLSSTEYIDYMGELKNKGEEKDQKVSLEITIEHGEVSIIKQINLNIKKIPKTKEEKLKDSLESIINNEDNIKKEKVSIPEEIGGQKTRLLEGEEEKTNMLLIGVIAAVFIFFFANKDEELSLKKRREELINDFPEFLSKLTIFIECGMSINTSIKEVVKYIKKESHLYKEVSRLKKLIDNGVIETQAYISFAEQINLNNYKSLANLLEQGSKKGVEDIGKKLTQEVENAYEEKKMIVKKKGEEASTKLIGPLMLMLVVVLIIMIVPAIIGMY